MRWTRTAVPFCASGIEAILLLSQSCFLFPWLALSAKMPHPTPPNYPPPKKQERKRKKGGNRRRLLGIQRVLAPPMELDSHAWAILHHQYKSTLICSSLFLSVCLPVCMSVHLRQRLDGSRCWRHSNSACSTRRPRAISLYHQHLYHQGH